MLPAFVIFADEFASVGSALILVLKIESLGVAGQPRALCCATTPLGIVTVVDVPEEGLTVALPVALQETLVPEVQTPVPPAGMEAGQVICACAELPNISIANATLIAMLMRFKILIVLIFLFGCTTTLPPAPMGTNWKYIGPYRNHGSLYAGNLELASFVDEEAWLFECGNTSATYGSTHEAVNAVVACGHDYIAGKFAPKSEFKKSESTSTTAKLSCIWQFNIPDDLYGRIDICVSDDGKMLGTVRKEHDWIAYQGGGYCENNGGGWVSRDAARKCIERIYDAKPPAPH